MHFDNLLQHIPHATVGIIHQLDGFKTQPQCVFGQFGGARCIAAFKHVMDEFDAVCRAVHHVVRGAIINVVVHIQRFVYGLFDGRRFDRAATRGHAQHSGGKRVVVDRLLEQQRTKGFLVVALDELAYRRKLRRIVR